MAVLMGRHDEWLDREVGEWVRAGIVSDEQADAIVRFEQRADAEAPVERLTVGAEVAAYLGSVLALMGGAFVVERRWDEIAFGGRLALAAAIAAVGFVAGAWLVHLREAGTTRLGGFMWAIGAGGVAMFVAVAADRVIDDPGWILLVVGVAVLVVGAGLWRNLERPLQLLTAAAGFVLVLSGIDELVDVPILVGSAVLIAVGGLLAVVAGFGRVAPRDLATALGTFCAFVGALSLGETNEHVGPFAALFVAALLVVHALVTRRVPLLVIGVLGTLIATQAVLMTTFSGALASMIVALIGLAVVVGAVLYSLHPSHHGHLESDGSGPSVSQRG